MIANTRQKEFINIVLDAFYTKAVSDILIGYQFRKIKEKAETSFEDIFFPALSSFSTHMARIRAFWHIQLLGEKKPASEAPFDLVSVHRPLFINRGEIDRWLFLFKKTLKDEQQKVDKNEVNQLCQQWLSKVYLIADRLKRTLL